MLSLQIATYAPCTPLACQVHRDNTPSRTLNVMHTRSRSQVTAARCVTSGVRCTSPPAAFTLPPHAAHHEVILYLVPQEPGSLKLEGIQLTALGLTTLHRVQNDGAAPEQRR